MGLRIAIINMTGGGMSGGYRVYLRNVLPRLAERPDVEAVLCVTPASLSVQSWITPHPKLIFSTCDSFRFMHHRPEPVLAQAIAKFAPDVVFIPVGRYMDFGDIPVFNMIQNMGPFLPTRGNPVSEHIRYIAQRHEVKIALRHARHIIVPTNFVREFFIKKWAIPASKITTIHYGSHTVKALIKKPSAIPQEWTGSFIFTAGSIEPYRGLEDIMDAMRNIRGRKEVRGLVIAGVARNNMRRYERFLRKRLQRYGLDRIVVWAGPLSEEEMSWCYANCSVFVMTSRVETFAIIGIEALSSGCICVVPKSPPFPEIFDTSVHYYTPHDSGDLAKKVSSILDWDDVRRQHASKVARDRASQFSWDNNTQALISVFKKVIQKNKPRPEVGQGAWRS